MRLLYIAPKFESNSFGGDYVCKRNLRFLKSILGEENVIEYHLKKSSLKRVIISSFSACSYGMSRDEEKRIIKMALANDCRIAFIELSLRGNLAQLLLRNSIRTITFAHKVESQLYKHLHIHAKTLISYFQYRIIRWNERKAINNTTKLITLTERDSLEMRKAYNRDADMIIPISTSIKKDLFATSHNDDYFLFVGSDFFPNVEGIAWFIKNVAPYINHEIWVVGSCCYNNAIKKLPLTSNVRLKGYIPDLDMCYRNALAVIAPIFSGSGMKTKTIEALSYGKSIFGTTEAFVGIETDFARIGGECNNAAEFIEKMNSLAYERINSYSIQLFLKYFSDIIAKKHFDNLIASLNNSIMINTSFIKK